MPSDPAPEGSPRLSPSPGPASHPASHPATDPGDGVDGAVAPPDWHRISGAAAARRLSVDPEQGLSSAEATDRTERFGANRLAAPPRRPAAMAPRPAPTRPSSSRAA